MITLARERDQRFVLEASRDWESAGSLPTLVLKVGDEDYSDRIPSGDWSQAGLAIDLEAEFAGNLPRRLYGAPVSLDVALGGVLIPALRGLVSLPEPNDDRATTKLLAASAGSLADKYPLRERVVYPGVRPDYVARDALRRLPYPPGSVSVDPMEAPLLRFAEGSEDGPFEPEQTPADVLSALSEKTTYAFRDDAYGGCRASASSGLASTEEVTLRYGSDELLFWKEPSLAAERYASVVVFRRGQDGRDVFPPVVEPVPYPNLDFLPSAGLALPVVWEGDEAGARRHGREKAKELSRGLYASEPVLPFFPLLEALDRFLVASVVDEDGTFYERLWLHHVEAFEQPWGEGFETKPSCQATLADEQAVKAPTLVLAAIGGGILPVPAPEIGGFSHWGQDDVFFGSEEMDVTFAELP